MKSKTIIYWAQGLMSCAVLMAVLCGPAIAQESKEKSENASDRTSLDLESLLNIKVTTASKFPEKLSDAPGLLSAVSNDELLRFGGMTVRSIYR